MGHSVPALPSHPHLHMQHTLEYRMQALEHVNHLSHTIWPNDVPGHLYTDWPIATELAVPCQWTSPCTGARGTLLRPYCVT